MGEKIFVVDDEPTVRQIYALILRGEGYNVEEFHHGREALEALDQHPDVKCIVSDKDMPHLSGVGLYRAVRKRGLKMPFFLISGGGGTVSKEDPTPLETVFRGDPRSAIRFKPLWAEELVEVVRSLLV